MEAKEKRGASRRQCGDEGCRGAGRRGVFGDSSDRRGHDRPRERARASERRSAVWINVEAWGCSPRGMNA